MPSDNHILCGRGNIHTKHVGNRKFARIIQAYSKEYASMTSRIQKIVVVTSVVNFLVESGMKFMRLDANTHRYVELSSELAHNKVSHAIRAYIKKTKREASKRKSSDASKLDAREAVHVTNGKLTRRRAQSTRLVDSHWKESASNELTIATTNLERTKKSATDSNSNQSINWFAQEKAASCPRGFDRNVASQGATVSGFFYQEGVPHLISPGVSNGSQEFDRMIVDLSETLGDNKFPRRSLKDETVQMPAMSSLSGTSDSVRIQASSRDYSCFMVDAANLEPRKSQRPASLSPQILQQLSQQQNVATNARGFTRNEEKATACSPCDVFEPFVSPLPVDSNAEFEEQDLRILSEILFDDAHDNSFQIHQE